MSVGDDRRTQMTWEITLTDAGLSLEKKAPSVEILDESGETWWLTAGQTEHQGSASPNAASPEGTTNECPQMTPQTQNFLKVKKCIYLLYIIHNSLKLSPILTPILLLAYSWNAALHQML